MATLCILVAGLLSEIPTIQPEDAPKYMNKTVVVRMKVVRSAWSGKYSDARGYLFPSDDRSGKELNIAIAKEAFNPKLKGDYDRFDGKIIEVTGKIMPQNPLHLVPRMRVTDLSQIKIVEDEE